MDNVSSLLSVAGDIAQIIKVFEFPPKAFCRILVKADYLYGGTVPLPFPMALSAKFSITLPRTVNDLLIFVACFRTAPWAPVFSIL